MVVIKPGARCIIYAGTLLTAHVVVAAASTTDMLFASVGTPVLSTKVDEIGSFQRADERNAAAHVERGVTVTSVVRGVSTTDEAARALNANSHSGGSFVRPEEDASSKIRTVFFEVVGACIGVTTLIVAILALRAMPKQRQHDPESQDGHSDLPSNGTASEQPPNHHTLDQMHELEAVQPAVDTQSERAEPSS